MEQTQSLNYVIASVIATQTLNMLEKQFSKICAFDMFGGFAIWDFLWD